MHERYNALFGNSVSARARAHQDDNGVWVLEN